MRYALALILFLLAATPGRTEPDAQLQSMVIAVTQHFVQEKLMFGPTSYNRIEFDVEYLYPQPKAGYWAVVGGFMSDQNIPNSFVAAVQLVCPEYKELDCWRLEKLAVNGTIVVDRGDPL